MSTSSPSNQYDMLDRGTQNAIPITIRVNKLTYSVTSQNGKWWERAMAGKLPWEWSIKGDTAHILKDVSFTAKSGNLMAIMGGSDGLVVNTAGHIEASQATSNRSPFRWVTAWSAVVSTGYWACVSLGGGKTSLLDVLACRNTDGTVTGDVYLNSVVRTKDILDSCAGYVRQDDRLISFLTVRETLTFVARLKLPRGSSKATVDDRVDLVIAELGLSHVADTKVGGESIRGLSGGERRRVSIGIQLLILPSVLFLDEPTSGLDSFTANNMVQTLSRLASKKRTIIMSIHQPRYEIFKIIDVVMILSKGKIVFNGPGTNMVSYFTTLGFPCPELSNPCDFYIDLATVDGTSAEREERTSKIVTNLQAAYEVQAEATKMFESDELVTEEQFKRSADSGVFYYPTGMTGRNEKEKLKSMLDAFAKLRTGPGFFVQLWVLLKRSLRMTIDDYALLLIQLIQATYMSVLIGVTYYDLGHSQDDIRDWLGLMFMMSILYPYLVILGLIGVCHDERKFLYYELQDKLYHPAAYYGARIMNDVPFHLVYNIFYCVPVYALAGLDWDPYTAFLFYVYSAMSVFTSRCMAMMVAAVFPTYQIACIVAQAFFTLFIMCAGFIMNLNNILEETAWISNLSYLRWAFEGLCLIEIKDVTFSCNNVTDCIPGQQVLAQYSFEDGKVETCAIGLLGTIGVFLSIMYLGMRFIPQRPNDS